MYYGSGTGGTLHAYVPTAEQTLRMLSPEGSTFLREMTSWPPS